jgi:hypothetical protein
MSAGVAALAVGAAALFVGDKSDVGGNSDVGGGGGGNPLKVGYLCFDFNDHPTAHLVEGLFVEHRLLGSKHISSQRMFGRPLEAVALSYGRDDGSDYRRAIEQHASE